MITDFLLVLLSDYGQQEASTVQFFEDSVVVAQRKMSTKSSVRQTVSQHSPLPPKPPNSTPKPNTTKPSSLSLKRFVRKSAYKPKSSWHKELFQKLQLLEAHELPAQQAPAKPSAEAEQMEVEDFPALKPKAPLNLLKTSNAVLHHHMEQKAAAPQSQASSSATLDQASPPTSAPKKQAIPVVIRNVS
ncbi:hypothetical protein HUJ05_001915 [Dendroctonus ponderosae]|nr:hypothetical protein HUJ05_001915 [Dendroctonus ponderosae]